MTDNYITVTCPHCTYWQRIYYNLAYGTFPTREIVCTNCKQESTWDLEWEVKLWGATLRQQEPVSTQQPEGE